MRYEEADCGRHEHLIDIQSGAVLEFRESGIEQLIREAAQRIGYSLVDYRLELFAESPGVATAEIRKLRGLDVEPSALARPRVPNHRGRKHYARP